MQAQNFTILQLFKQRKKLLDYNIFQYILFHLPYTNEKHIENILKGEKDEL